MKRTIKIIFAFAIAIFIVYLSHEFVLEKAGKYLYYKDKMQPADVIVILAGEETERVDYGVKLFREGWARKNRIILTGGPLVWKYTWASLMKEHAMSLGVMNGAILLEDKSTSTEEDALFTKEILNTYKYTSFILVTSPYHSKRAAVIFRKIMGNEITLISAPAEKSWFSFSKWWERRRDREKVLNEYSKFIWLWVFGIQDDVTS